MWTENEKEFIRIWKSIQKNEGENNMNKKNQQIGKGYISDLKKFENKLTENFTESFVNRMYRGGYDYYESVDEQIREYLEEKMTEGSLYSLFPLLKEFEKKYGKSKYKKHFTFGNK